MVFKLTAKQQKAEILKCGRDVEYFIKNYVQIQHPTKGYIPFKLFPYQKDVVKEFKRNRFNIILKSRQLGMSTLSAAYILHMCLFGRGKRVVIVSQRQRDAADVLKKIKLAWKRLPKFFHQLTMPTQIVGDKIGSSSFLEFTNGSSIGAEATTQNAGRGGSLSLLVIDEAAAINNKDITEMWASIYPTLSTGGDCLIISTPRGVGNFYHKMWTEAEVGDNDFNPIKLHWTQHPDYDEEWYEAQKRNMSATQIAQELDCSFENSGDTFFDKEDLKRISKFVESYETRPVFYEQWCIDNKSYDIDENRTLRQLPERAWRDRNYWIWERPRPGFDYVIGCDVARGDGKDYSAAVVLKVQTGEIVAEYKGKCVPSDFAGLLESIGNEYGEAMIVVENNKDGYTVLTELENREYPNIFYSFRSNYQYCSPDNALYENNVVAGLSTGPRSRPLFLSKMEEYIRNNYLTIYSSRMINEMMTFIYHNGKAQAQESCNDDLVMALTMAVWAREIAYSKSKKEAEYAKAFLSAMTKSTNSLDTRISGMIGFENKMKEAVEKRKAKKALEANKKKMYWSAVIKG